MRLGAHFRLDEFRCRCCGRVLVSPQLIDKLNTVRTRFGKPMVVTSGFRCAKHDDEIGGSGAHTSGRAVDIRCTNMLDRRELVRAALLARFPRVEVCDRHIHLDVVTDRAEGLWLGRSR